MQYPHSKIWILNAGLDIKKGSIFYINSTDTNWLKIANNGINPNGMDVFGIFIIDSVRINQDTKTNGTPQTLHHKLITNRNNIIPAIKIDGGVTGTLIPQTLKMHI
jgi:hypothetical protein